MSQCHSEALAEACPEQSEGTHEILHGVYPEPIRKTLRFTQGDRWRRVQDDTSCQILHRVYPEPKSETLPLRFTQGQGDTWRRVQNDKHAISLIVTQPLGGRGRDEGAKWQFLQFSVLNECIHPLNDFMASLLSRVYFNNHL